MLYSPHYRLGEIAKRAGPGITLARVARAALGAGLDKVSEAMDRERTAAAATPPVQAPR